MARTTLIELRKTKCKVISNWAQAQLRMAGTLEIIWDVKQPFKMEHRRQIKGDAAFIRREQNAHSRRGNRKWGRTLEADQRRTRARAPTGQTFSNILFLYIILFYFLFPFVYE